MTSQQKMNISISQNSSLHEIKEFSNAVEYAGILRSNVQYSDSTLTIILERAIDVKINLWITSFRLKQSTNTPATLSIKNIVKCEITDKVTDDDEADGFAIAMKIDKDKVYIGSVSYRCDYGINLTVSQIDMSLVDL